RPRALLELLGALSLPGEPHLAVARRGAAAGRGALQLPARAPRGRRPALPPASADGPDGGDPPVHGARVQGLVRAAPLAVRVVRRRLAQRERGGGLSRSNPSRSARRALRAL